MYYGTYTTSGITRPPSPAIKCFDGPPTVQGNCSYRDLLSLFIRVMIYHITDITLYCIISVYITMTLLHIRINISYMYRSLSLYIYIYIHMYIHMFSY